MRKAIIAAALWVCAAPNAQAQNPDVNVQNKAALRRLLPTPSALLRQTASLSITVGSVPVRGYTLFHYADAPRADVSGIMATEQALLRVNGNDAQATFRLAALCQYTGEKEASQAGFVRAAVLFGDKIKENPQNPWLWTGQGIALARAGQGDAAAAVLVRATDLPRSPWQAWAARGDLLERGAEAGKSGEWQAAGACFNRAVAAAPNAAPPRYRRALFVHARAMGERHNDFAPYSLSAMQDIDRAVQESADPYFIACAENGVALYGSFAQRGTAAIPTSNRVYDALPKDVQRSVQAAMRRLRELTHAPNAAQAASAEVALAWMEYEVLYRPAQTENTLRRALARDPSCAEAATYLSHILLSEEDNKAAAVFLRGRLRAQKTVRDRAELAYALSEDGQNGAAADALQGLPFADWDSSVNLAYAVLRLRQTPSGSVSLDVAGLALAEVAKEMTVQTPVAVREAYGLTQGLWLALSGQREAAVWWLSALPVGSGNASAVGKALVLLR